MKKILYVLFQYPQISETYVDTEIRALGDRYQTSVVTFKNPDLAYKNHQEYKFLNSHEELVQLARQFKPDIIHAHWLFMLNAVKSLSDIIGVPFTVRSHSFDVFGQMSAQLPALRDKVNSENCAGILGFPAAIPLFERAGYAREKLTACYPVVDYARFHDEAPNGNAIMNVGACTPKKKMEDYLLLAKKFPDKTFNLYPMGYYKDDIASLNDKLGRPVNISEPVEPADMKAEYKKHEWLVYTASSKEQTVGWPIAVAEAQAAGVGVCLQNVRPDVKEYVGGAGFIFDTLEEAARIISNPVTEDLRQRGFEQARKSDVKGHIQLLENLWSQAT